MGCSGSRPGNDPLVRESARVTCRAHRYALNSSYGQASEPVPLAALHFKFCFLYRSLNQVPTRKLEYKSATGGDNNYPEEWRDDVPVRETSRIRGQVDPFEYSSAKERPPFASTLACRVVRCVTSLSVIIVMTCIFLEEGVKMSQV